MNPLSILLVDDNEDYAEPMADLLRLDGHRVSIVRDGATAIALAATLAPQVVLLDLGLPDLDGYDVARTLRNALPSTTPIIVVTGQREARSVNEVDLVLNKPVQAELFSGLIEYVCRRRRNTMPAP